MEQKNIPELFRFIRTFNCEYYVSILLVSAFVTIDIIMSINQGGKLAELLLHQPKCLVAYHAFKFRVPIPLRSSFALHPFGVDKISNNRSTGVEIINYAPSFNLLVLNQNFTSLTYLSAKNNSL